MKQIRTIEVIIYKMIHNSPYFLLLKRKPEIGGFWQPVVGKVGPHEAFEDAVYRECREEVGLEKSDILEFTPKFYEFSFDKHYLTGKSIKPIVESVYAIMTVPTYVPDLSKNPDVEHDECKWVNYSTAMQYLKWEDNKKAFRLVVEKYLTKID